ncbi:MAG: class I SAM-dependent methyltransferase [Bacteroidia bacterium]|nr:class I SAM-dependent methyltransferase [Bacteroidia bacterium]
MQTFLKTKDFAVSGEEFRLLYDQELDMLVTDPQPKEIDKYYLSSSYISHTDSFETFSDQLYHLVKKYMLWKKIRMLERYLGKSGSVLDIGAGTGDFLRIAQKRGWDIEGVEPNPMARGLAIEKQLPLKSDMKDLVGMSFDVITLWHTLEHIPDLDGQIDAMLECLKEDGIMVVAVPNFKSRDAKYYKEYWAAYDVPRHLWHFSQEAIERIFKKHQVKLIKKSPLRFDAYYIALLSEKYKNGKSNYLRAFWMGMRSNISAWQSKEYSSMLYILKRR